jgi:PAS domain S-box-containing protein
MIQRGSQKAVTPETDTTRGIAALLRPATERIASRATVARVRVWQRIDGEPNLRLVADVGDGPALDDELLRLPSPELERWVASRDQRAADREGAGALLAQALGFDGRARGVLTIVARGSAGADDRSWLRVVADCVAATMVAAEAVGHVESVRADLERVNANLQGELRDAFEEAPIPYVHEGLDTRFIRANRAALDLLGIGADDVATTFGRTFVADTSENQRRLKEALEGVAQGRDTRHAILELRRKDDGRPVWVQWWSQAAPSGAYTRTMMVDITDRVLAEQTRNALQLSMESGQVGDWDLDLVNDTWRRSLRHDQCFGYDTPIPEGEWGMARFLEHVHTEDRERVDRSMRQAVAELEDWTCEFRVVWANGSVHWLVARGRVHRTKDRKAERMLGVIMDITERTLIAEALRETKAAMDFALESARIGDWDLDVIHDTSRRSLRHDQCFGHVEPIPESEWGVERFSKFLHPEDRDRVLSSMQGAVAAGTDWASEFRVVWEDGSLHWLEARGRVYRTNEGKATRMLGIVMDITERKEADVTLRAAEQLARGQVEALRSTLDALAVESDGDRLVEHILRTMTDQFGAHSSSVWRRDPATDTIGFEFAFEKGTIVKKSHPSLAGLDMLLPMGDSWPWPEVFRKGRASVIEDIREVPAFALRDRLLSKGIITVLLVPMSIGGKLEGAVGLRFTERRAFRDQEVDLAQALANQLMLAMHLNQLSAQSLASAVVEERNRMARDIHDTLAQGFTGVIIQLEAAADATSRGLASEAVTHMERAGRLAREGLGEARRSLRALRPQELEDKTLPAAIAALIGKMTEGTEVRSQVVVRGMPRELPPEWDENLLRIGQEVATNMLRHAVARCFDVQMTFAPDEVKLELQDDGRGFDTSVVHDGFGLLGVGERVDRMGGTLAIRSSKGGGTTVSIALPLPADFQEAAP